jgi:hypothetical protein
MHCVTKKVIGLGKISHEKRLHPVMTVSAKKRPRLDEGTVPKGMPVQRCVTKKVKTQTTNKELHSPRDYLTKDRIDNLSISRSSPQPLLSETDDRSSTITGINLFKARRIEEVPSHNKHVFTLAKAIVAAEFLTTDPWPEAAAVENFVHSAWTKGRAHLQQQQEKQFGLSFRWKTGEPDHLADEISKHIVYYPYREHLDLN